MSTFQKQIKVQELVLVDREGRKRAVLSTPQGRPTFVVYDGKGKIRAWATLTAEGTLDARTVDVNGKLPWQYKSDTESHDKGYVMGNNNYDQPSHQPEVLRRQKSKQNQIFPELGEA